MTEEESQPKKSLVCDDLIVPKETEDETEKIKEVINKVVSVELSVNKTENIKTYVVKKQHSEKQPIDSEKPTNKMILVKMSPTSIPNKSKKNKIKIKTSEVQGDDSSPAKMKREVKQLQQSMDNSKILTEYINDSETRKSRRQSKFDDSESTFSRSRSVSVSESLQDDEGKKRSNMRSHNSDFLQKQQKFLNRIQSSQDSDGVFNSEDESIDSKSTDTEKTGMHKKPIHPAPKEGSDPFCWRCHLNGPEMIACCSCPRSFHLKCLKVKSVKTDWTCLECENVATCLTSPK